MSVTWVEHDVRRTAAWGSESGPPPAQVAGVDDTLNARDAWRLASQGVGMLWSGDFHQARQLLAAMGRRAEPVRRRAGEAPAQTFYRYRQSRSQRARMLSMLLVEVEPGHVLRLGRAPDVVEVCTEAFGPCEVASVRPLQEVLGAVGAHEWRRRGVFVAALDARIHPHYGTFAPTRSEYVDLVASAPLPPTELAFDIGTGTGVLAAVLAQRGVRRVVATDDDPAAIACATDNLGRLGLADRVEPRLVPFFPDGTAGLIVCNPPWIPATGHTRLDHAVYDPGSRMLAGFLDGVTEHLDPDGEAWLVISDLAEHLGLRAEGELAGLIAQAGLRVVGSEQTRPDHGRATDADDSLAWARAQEVTTLWRLRPEARPTRERRR